MPKLEGKNIQIYKDIFLIIKIIYIYVRCKIFKST